MRDSWGSGRLPRGLGMFSTLLTGGPRDIVALLLETHRVHAHTMLQMSVHPSRNPSSVSFPLWALGSSRLGCFAGPLCRQLPGRQPPTGHDAHGQGGLRRRQDKFHCHVLFQCVREMGPTCDFVTASPSGAAAVGREPRTRAQAGPALSSELRVPGGSEAAPPGVSLTSSN